MLVISQSIKLKCKNEMYCTIKRKPEMTKTTINILLTTIQVPIMYAVKN